MCSLWSGKVLESSDGLGKLRKVSEGSGNPWTDSRKVSKGIGRFCKDLGELLDRSRRGSGRSSKGHGKCLAQVHRNVTSSQWFPPQYKDDLQGPGLVDNMSSEGSYMRQYLQLTLWQSIHFPLSLYLTLKQVIAARLKRGGFGDALTWGITVIF